MSVLESATKPHGLDRFVTVLEKILGNQTELPMKHKNSAQVEYWRMLTLSAHLLLSLRFRAHRRPAAAVHPIRPLDDLCDIPMGHEEVTLAQIHFQSKDHLFPFGDVA